MKPSTALFALIIFCSCAHAENETLSVATPVEIHAEDAKGANLREQVNALFRLVQAKRFSEADLMAKRLRSEFESTFDPKLKQHTFQSQSEYEEFKADNPQRFEWIDWGYKECLQMQAFLKSERKDFAGALAQLTELESIAPASAGTLIEKGYIQNGLKKFDEALTTYQVAVALSLKYKSQGPFRAPALRGLGFSLIELHRLDEAEQAFKASLDIDPGNQLARNELAYISDLRAQK